MVSRGSGGSGSLTEVSSSVCRLGAEGVEHNWVSRDLDKGKGGLYECTYDSSAKMVLEAVDGFDQKIIFTIIEWGYNTKVAEDFLGDQIVVVLVLMQRNQLENKAPAAKKSYHERWFERSIAIRDCGLDSVSTEQKFGSWDIEKSV